MKMRLEEFKKQRRGPYLFDRWQWKRRVETGLGSLVVELSILDDDPAPPDETMVTLAKELSEFATAHAETILDRIYGHYRYAEKEEWLEFWKVPARLGRDEVLSQVESIDLVVARTGDEHSPYEAGIHVNPNWDREHKLHLSYRDGKISEINDGFYELKDGVLYPRE